MGQRIGLYGRASWGSGRVATSHDPLQYPGSHHLFDARQRISDRWIAILKGNVPSVAARRVGFSSRI
jgi:hypothetical protein